MPAKIKVQIVAARDLPVMDRSSDLADAFAEVRLGNMLHKTDVCKKSLNPQWNSEWFRFEADDEELQDEPLQIRIMDYDTVTAHDAIGKVNISLGPLLTQDPPGSIGGWFPIYDTMHGIRGEVKVIVKVDYFIDSNKFRQSSCGVQLFYTCSVPFGHKALAIHGFVEELVVNDDPEYQWIDKIRTPRSSNEARQRLFTKLSGELQRKIGLKVLDAGGNAVIGYRQCFDLEGEYGIVVRGVGTAVTLVGVLVPAGAGSSRPSTPIHVLTSSGELGPGSLVSDSGFNFPETFQSLPVPSSKVTAPASRRRVSSSDSDPGSESPPKDRVALLAGSVGVDSSSGSTGGASFPRPKGLWQVTQKQKTVDDLEFPFFTITKFPAGFLRHIGGVVTARSVKLLDKINHPDEPETRDAWWSEVRMEIRSHARALGCHAVIGYYENTSICDELIVLSASGTAACVDLQLATAEFLGAPQGILSPLREKSVVTPGSPSHAEPVDPVTADTPEQDGTSIAEDVPCTSSSPLPACSVCHIPYSDIDLPFPILLTKCQVCRQKKVPDVIFSTTEPPSECPVVGRGCLLQARVCRVKKKDKGEANADLVSTILPFLEYELHQQLLNKLKVKGMNALFGLHLQISVGESLIVGTASSTAVFLAALPAPPLLKITGRRVSSEEDKRLAEIQKQIVDTTNKNRASFRLTDTVHIHTPKATPPPSPSQNAPVNTAEVDQDEGPKAELDLCAGPKDAYVVEVDDKKDEDVVAVLLDEPAPEGFYSCNTETLPGAINLKSGVKMVTAVQRKSLSDEDIRTNQQFAKLFEDTIKSFWFKLRNMSPCCLSNVHFDIEIPEDDNIQVAVTGVAVCVEEKEGDEGNTSRNKRHLCDRSHSRTSQNSDTGMESDDLLFPIDEVVETAAPVENVKCEKDPKPKRRLVHPLSVKTKIKVPYRPAVEVTSMSYLPNTQIEQYLGNVNLFLIRESHTVRENGGLNVFMQAFVAEAQAILKAHVLAIGGNALVSYQLNEIVLLDNPHKHQGQCLLNISGDAVKVFFEEDESLDSSGRGSPRKRTLSYSEVNPHTPIQVMRQRSISASETSTGTLIGYDPYYGTEI